MSSEKPLVMEDLEKELQDWIWGTTNKTIKYPYELFDVMPEPLRTMAKGKYNNEEYKWRLLRIYNETRKSVDKKKNKPLSSTQKKKVSDIKFPFKSKIKEYVMKHGINKDSIKKEDYIPDYDIKTLAKKYKRPNYSPEPYSYEMDIMFASPTDNYDDSIKYLVLININTRYLWIKKITGKSAEEVIETLKEATKHLTIKNIKSDGERAFMSKALTKFRNDNKIAKATTDGSPFTFHNKHVDSVIRTIRNAAGLSYDVLRQPTLVKKIVDYYNNTPHSGLPLDENGIHYTPKEVQNNIDIEWKYIRQKDQELKKVYEKLSKAGYDKYKKGNVLLLHLDTGKTNRNMQKKRRNFQDVGLFVKYVKGNVCCQLLTGTTNDKNITVPIFYTKKIANSYDKLEEKYKDYFNLPETIVFNTGKRNSKN